MVRTNTKLVSSSLSRQRQRQCATLGLMMAYTGMIVLQNSGVHNMFAYNDQGIALLHGSMNIFQKILKRQRRQRLRRELEDEALESEEEEAEDDKEESEEESESGEGDVEMEETPEQEGFSEEEVDEEETSEEEAEEEE
ncbi:hypothetical protein BDV93DRAFT_526239 [Ceratobasidium sp. AG-I]|nr:hypothetical protein BDV93DRAFT_526239 [Ceratobasidium sp. AG-I]